MSNRDHAKTKSAREQKRAQFSNAGGTISTRKKLLFGLVVAAVGVAGYFVAGNLNGQATLLADEPTGTLDTKTGDEIMRLFLALNGRGQTIFMVSHNPANAALTHRVLHIRDGRLEGEVGDSGRPGMVRADGTLVVPQIAQSLSIPAQPHTSGAAIREFRSLDAEVQ